MVKMLNKQFGLFGGFVICTGAMISSGLFVLTGIAVSKCGSAVILAYLLFGLLHSEEE